jgi:hypothetical protein
VVAPISLLKHATYASVPPACLVTLFKGIPQWPRTSIAALSPSLEITVEKHVFAVVVVVRLGGILVWSVDNNNDVS